MFGTVVNYKVYHGKVSGQEIIKNAPALVLDVREDSEGETVFDLAVFLSDSAVAYNVGSVQFLSNVYGGNVTGTWSRELPTSAVEEE